VSTYINIELELSDYLELDELEAPAKHNDKTTEISTNQQETINIDK